MHDAPQIFDYLVAARVDACRSSAAVRLGRPGGVTAALAWIAGRLRAYGEALEAWAVAPGSPRHVDLLSTPQEKHV